MLDKQSIAESGKYQKAWVKIQYKQLQHNLEYPDKSYNNAKLLWYFNCAEQKSASIQVYQLLNDEQVFSAAIDVKRARFIEPVPETETALAMRYVCKKKAAKEAVMAKAKLAQEQAAASEGNQETKAAAKSGNESAKTAAEKVEQPAVEDVADKEEQATDEEKGVAADKAKKKKKKSKKRKSKKLAKIQWSYEGDDGPEFWGDLDEEFATCKTGQSQSPINIDNTVSAKLKPLKTFLRFPAKDIVHNGHTVQVSFKKGNVLALDDVMYQMKQVHFHAPSENTIKGESFPLEAHFVHEDAEGNLVVLAVMFKEGAENRGLKKLWLQLPNKKSRAAKKLKTKVFPTELIPSKKGYYRFNGSLTTPPCSEGVIWFVKKATMTASKSQIDAFTKAMKHHNNRPVQLLNSRFILAK